MGVYSGPVAAAAAKAAAANNIPVRIVDLTGRSFDDALAASVAQGRPLQVITNATFRPLTYNVDPRSPTVPPDEHSIVVIGYTPTTVTIRDPLLGRNNSNPSDGTLTVPRGQFEAAWQQMGSQAISYEPIP
jgi:uncharacterized protein YvpB